MDQPPALLPQDLEPTASGFLEGAPPKRLAYHRWEHPNPVGRVVIVHGYGEHGRRYCHVAHWLHERGWSVSALDQEGFGASSGTRGDARGIRPFVEDLVTFLHHERHHDVQRVQAPPRMVDGVPMPPLPTGPQVVLGHSFGGLVALLALLWHPEALDGLVLSSPALALRPHPWFLRWAQKLLLHLAPHHPLDLPNDKAQVCSDPVFLQRYWADPLCHRQVTAAFAAALVEGQRELRGLGSEIARPILLLEAGNDTVVDPDASKTFWDQVPSDLLERHRFEGLRHELFHDLQRDVVFARLDVWLKNLREGWNPALPQATMEGTKDSE